jgi:hypothetical protein
MPKYSEIFRAAAKGCRDHYSPPMPEGVTQWQVYETPSMDQSRVMEKVFISIADVFAAAEKAEEQRQLHDGPCTECQGYPARGVPHSITCSRALSVHSMG